MPLNLQFDDVLGRHAKRQRQQASVALAQDLMNKGLEPETINQAVASFVKTGTPQIPTMQTKALPFDPDVPEGRSTRVPTRFSKQKGLFTLDQGSGAINQVETPADMTDYEVKTIPPQKAQKPVNNNKGHTLKVDRATGQMADQGENGRTYNDYVYWDSRANRPADGGGKDPQDDLAKDTIKKYQAALLKGEDIPDESMDSVRSAADRLGIDIAEVQKDPGIVDTFLGRAADVVNKVPGAPKVEKPAPKFGGSSVRFKPKGGKPLTKDKAQQFLQKAKGDKKKARDLATQAGYTF